MMLIRLALLCALVTIPAYADPIQSVLQQNQSAIILFYKPGCGPCKKLVPAFESARQRLGNSLNFLLINVSGTATHYLNTYGVGSVPTVLCCKNGSIVHRSVGGNISQIIASVFGL